MAGHGKLGLFEPIVKWLKNAIKHVHHGSTPHPHAAPHTTPRWRGKPLDPHYNFETIPNHPQNPFGSRAVRRLTPQELENHRVFIDQHGTFRNAHDGSLFDSRGSTTHWGRGQSDRAIFTMDPNGNIYASKYQAVGDFHHSTLANGHPVAGAGEIVVHDGKVQWLTSNSGHYKPGIGEMQQVLGEFGRHGVSPVPVFNQIMQRIL